MVSISSGRDSWPSCAIEPYLESLENAADEVVAFDCWAVNESELDVSTAGDFIVP